MNGDEKVAVAMTEIKNLERRVSDLELLRKLIEETATNVHTLVEWAKSAEQRIQDMSKEQVKVATQQSAISVCTRPNLCVDLEPRIAKLEAERTFRKGEKKAIFTLGAFVIGCAALIELAMHGLDILIGLFKQPH